jgi:hypothetical protein
MAKKILVRVGNVTYKIIRRKDEFVCPCGSIKDPCSHIETILKDKYLNEFAIPWYHKLKKDLCDNYGKKDFREIIDKKIEDILESDCGFCCEALSKDHKNEQWVLCNECYNLSHHKCYHKWEPKKKGCMYCRK